MRQQLMLVCLATWMVACSSPDTVPDAANVDVARTDAPSPDATHDAALDAMRDDVAADRAGDDVAADHTGDDVITDRTGDDAALDGGLDGGLDAQETSAADVFREDVARLDGPSADASEVSAADVSDVSSSDASRTDATTPDAGLPCARDLDCPDLTFCDAPTSSCRPIVCTPGRVTCLSTARARVCDARGASSSDVDCVGGCTGSTCSTEAPCVTPRMVCGATCVDVRSDNAHCGGCGRACASAMTCVDGSCRCTSGQTLCGSACVDTRVDATNCGACGVACPSGATCASAACVCGGGRTLCGSACVDTVSDARNCGACGVVCATGESCLAGACVAPTGTTFRIRSLGASGCAVRDHESVTGDDRGGIAVSPSTVFVTGDVSTARLDPDTLDGASLGRIVDGLASNLRTGTVYTLANGSTPVTGAGTVTTLIELEGATGAVTSRTITLSSPITLTTDTGIFSGWDRVVLASGGRVWNIDLATGRVLDLGAMPFPSHTNCESWAFWGIAEFFDDRVHLAFVNTSTRIQRVRVPDGLTTTIGTFANLSDMCTFTASTARSRWYFHYENAAQFGGTSETVGYCPAYYEVAGSVACPSGTSFCGVECIDVLSDPANCGRCGNACAAGQTCTAGACAAPIGGDGFRVDTLGTSGCRIVDHDAITGDDRGGIAMGADTVFYTGDTRTGVFNADSLAGAAASFAETFIASDLRTGTTYALRMEGYAPPAEGNLLGLRELSASGLGADHPLSTPIRVGGELGIFSGWGRVVIASRDRVYSIAVPSGVVTDLGVMPMPDAHTRCETTAFWGVAEVIDGRVHLDFVRNSTQVVRMRVPDAATSVLASFSNLGDMCAFTVSPTRNRWYFHHEGGSQFGGTSETLGSCDATISAGAPVVCAASAPLRCGALCYDGQTDDANCGRCGNACPTGQACRAGVCTALGGLARYVATAPPTSVSFVDACGEATAAHMLVGADNATQVTPMPFAFPFWGDVLPRGHAARVATAGYLSFDTTRTGLDLDGALPSVAPPNGVIAPWLSPMRTDTAVGICYVTLGAAPSRRFIVQWQNALTVSPSYTAGRITTELIANEADGTIDLLTTSNSIPAGAFAPIGVESLDGTRGASACGFSACPPALTRIRFVPSP